MRNFLGEITKNKYNQGGLIDAERSQTGHFREQRKEQVVLTSVVRRVRCKDGTRTSSSPQLSKTIAWELRNSPSLTNTSSCNEETCSRYRSRDCGLLQDSRKSLVPTHRPVAPAIASQLQELKRLTQISESFHLLNVIRKLVREYARQSPKALMPQRRRQSDLSDGNTSRRRQS